MSAQLIVAAGLAVLNVLGWIAVIVAWTWRDRLVNELRDAVHGEIRLELSRDGWTLLDVSLRDARHIAHMQGYGGEARK